jgi:hypothetical protein
MKLNPSSPWPRRLLKASLLAAWFSTALAIALFALTRQSLRELAEFSAPDGAYHLIVMQSDRDWRGLPFSVGWHYFLYVGRESHHPTYGHTVDYQLHPAMTGFFDSDLGPYARKAIVTWTNDGVTFQEPSGHRVFIPEAAYARGR